jgi:ATP synthase protein I
MAKPSNAWRDVGMFSGIGFAFAVFVFGGFFLGRWLDGFFGSSPWLAFAGGLCGFLAAIIELINMLRKR